MVGVKATFKPPVLRMRPYAQVSVGYFATSTANVSSLPSGTNFGNSGAAYEVLGGLDIPIAPVVDFRVVEIGAGQAFGLFNSKSSGLITINTGVTVHF